MASFRFIENDDKRYLWRDLLALRREQRKAHARAATACPVRTQGRSPPVTERTAAGRYREPTLFLPDLRPCPSPASPILTRCNPSFGC
jgi:hypothetical protein